METGEEMVPIYGSRQWDKLNQAERDELSLHLSSWLFSQFLHGEQGALTVAARRSEEHTSELQSQSNLVCRLLLEKKKNTKTITFYVSVHREWRRSDLHRSTRCLLQFPRSAPYSLALECWRCVMTSPS